MRRRVSSGFRYGKAGEYNLVERTRKRGVNTQDWTGLLIYDIGRIPSRGRLLVELLALAVHTAVSRLRNLVRMKRAVFLGTSIVKRVPSAVIDFDDLLRKEVSI